MDIRQRTWRVVAGGAALIAMVGCGDGVGVAGPQQLSLNFRVGGVSSAAAPVPGLATVSGPAAVDGPLDVPGSNGTITLDSIFVVINEVELHPADGSCDAVDSSGSDSSDDCPEFEAPPRFLDLPLDGEPVEAVTALMPAGAYKELDFEIEDLEDDETDPAEAALIAAVRSEIRSRIPDWPDKASALVVGSFAPSGGGSVDFRVFLEAEIEIEFELIPNLIVDDAGAASRDLTVDVRPDIWFGRPDGTVIELHLYDYDSTGQLLEFEVEMEDGFTEIEYDN